MPLILAVIVVNALHCPHKLSLRIGRYPFPAERSEFYLMDSWYRLLFDHSMDGIFLTKPDGAVLAANPAACQILGYTQEEICRLGRAGLVAAGEPRLPGALTRRSQDGDFRGRLDFVHKDGSIVPVELASRQFVGSDGQSLTSLIFRDVSAQLRAEQALQESEERYRTAFVTCPDAMTITDLPLGRYIDVNDGFADTFGWTRAEVVGRLSVELGIWQDPADRGRFLDELARTGQCTNFETRFLTKNRTSLTALVSSHQLTIAGQPCILTVTRDISQRKLVETELQQHRHHLQELVDLRTRELVKARDAAEVASIAKSAFLANMSHEIRTPMNAILGFAHLLRRSALSQDQHRHMDKLAQAADHLLELIDGILDLSKIEAGKLTLETVDFQLSTLLQGIHTLIAPAASAKGLDVVIEPFDLPDNLRGDPTRLRQALLNLAGNAVKFTHQGSITVRARLCADIDTRVLVRFEVIDTGIGIAGDMQDRLFQRFTQVDTSTTRLYGGTGLGLAITGHLAKSMGGEAGVDSAEGVGSCFWFTAWLDKGRQTDHNVLAAAPTAEFELKRNYANTRVLLAEDNPINREVAVILLTEVGLTVDCVGNGREAVDVVKATSDHVVILMDVQMPEMDGLAATRLIRQIQGNQSLPIIAMTANASADDRQRCIEAGMDDVLVKPVNPQHLFEALIRWLPKPS